MMWMMMVSGAVTMFAFCYIFTIGYQGKGIMEGVALRYDCRVFDGGANGGRSLRHLSGPGRRGNNLAHQRLGFVYRRRRAICGDLQA